MQDTYKALHIYGTIDFSIVLWRDMEKLQVYLCQSTTRLAQSGPNCLHFVQVFKNVFCACSFLLFPTLGVSIGLATHSPPQWCTLLHPPSPSSNSIHSTGKFINLIESFFLAISRSKSGGRVHEAILPGQNLKGNLSDQILWTNSATRCISPHTHQLTQFIHRANSPQITRGQVWKPKSAQNYEIVRRGEKKKVAWVQILICQGSSALAAWAWASTPSKVFSYSGRLDGVQVSSSGTEAELTCVNIRITKLKIDFKRNTKSFQTQAGWTLDSVYGRDKVD